MLFSSTVFLFLFIPAVLILYYNPFVKKREYRNVVLLIASILFYAWGEPGFVLIMLLSIVLNWIAGIKLEKAESKAKRRGLIGITAFNIGLLFVYGL